MTLSSLYAALNILNGSKKWYEATVNLTLVQPLLGRFFYGFALALLPCLWLALFDEYGSDSYVGSIGFSASCALCLFFGWILRLGTRKASFSQGLYRKEAIALVVLIWICASFAGSLPYLLSSVITSPIDALFESVSGFTTTGASILESKKFDAQGLHEVAKAKSYPLEEGRSVHYHGTITATVDAFGVTHHGIEALPRSLLLWRSLSQWLGGCGIVVLFVTLLPMAGIGSKVLFQSEVSGPSKESLTPRIKETAHILWFIYLLLSLVQWLWILGAVPHIGWFDALTITFSTISTGGFSNYNASLGHFHSGILEWIVIIFMTAGSINFYLFFHLWWRRFYKLIDVELFLFFSILFFGSCYCSITLHNHPVEWLNGGSQILTWTDALRTGTFQFVSMMSSTGMATVNFDHWPFGAQILLFLAMMIGGMSGSTSGGIKVIRPYIVARYVVYRLRMFVRPDQVEIFRLQNKEMDLQNITMVLTFFCLCVFFLLMGSVFFIFTGLEPLTSLSLANCFLNNTGQAFRLAGPTESFAFLTPFSKLASCFMMLLGRLEYFTLLIVMMPSFWKKS